MSGVVPQARSTAGTKGLARRPPRARRVFRGWGVKGGKNGATGRREGEAPLACPLSPSCPASPLPGPSFRTWSTDTTLPVSLYQ